MDIFYYWKNHEEDLKAGRIGWLKSDRKKLGMLKDRHPDYIWAFNTPAGQKGKLQLLARLAWSDLPKVSLPQLEATSNIFYDPSDSKTNLFKESDSAEAIESVTHLLRSQFPSAFSSNFQGDNGLQVMEADFLHKFCKLVDRYAGNTSPLLVNVK